MDLIIEILSIVLLAWILKHCLNVWSSGEFVVILNLLRIRQSVSCVISNALCLENC